MDERQRTISMCDQHGSSLYLLGCAITDDPDKAAHVVAQAVAQTSGRSAGLSRSEHEVRRELGKRVYLECIGLGSPSSMSPRHVGRSGAGGSVPSTVEWLRALPAQQRASIALCVLGGHSYREAATLLGLAAPDVAALLHSACRATPQPPLPREHLTEHSPPEQIVPGDDPAEIPRRATLTNNNGGVA